MKHNLLLKNQARNWENGTPVGCGSLGMMVHGRTAKELLVLNEESIWAGYERKCDLPDFKENIRRIRELFLAGKNDVAEKTAHELLDSSFTCINSYETAGFIHISFLNKGVVRGYRRELDLFNGVASVTYKKGDVSFKTTAFASHPDNVMCWRLCTDSETDFNIEFKRENMHTLTCENGLLTAVCDTVVGDHPFAVCIKVCTDGELVCNNGFEVKNAKDTVVYIGIATSFKVADYVQQAQSSVNHSAEDYDDILKRHTDDFSAIMQRCEINLTSCDNLDEVPVNKRLLRMKLLNKEDVGLASIYFDFGRYLLASSSREDTLPANLQGVWAEKYQNSWNADYHTNINLQMNYWHAEIANLPDCHKALFNYMNKYLLEQGKVAAMECYGARGTVLHHVSDIYGFTAPADGLWGLWPMGSAWLAYHMWEHYLFSEDLDFLKNDAYEFIKNCALFFLDYMFEDENGRLLSGPSASPENKYYFGPNRARVNLCLSPAMDTEIIGGLFRFYIKAAELLGVDEDMAQQVKTALSKMPEIKVGDDGRLMEWLEQYSEPEPGHRHISHAFALYPGHDITRNQPELFNGIRRTIEHRLAHGGGHTGWSRAWLINLFARLREPQEAWKNFNLLLKKSTNDNLFDSHPPFQIDGNFGGAAALCEMLVQSHEGFISLLPATPACFTGSFRGIMARGGTQVDAELEEGSLVSVTFTNKADKIVRVELPEKQKNCRITVNGEAVEAENGFISLELTAGKATTVKFNR